MRLSVITITCRENPRLSDMAKTLAASLAREPGVELEWIIVDEHGSRRGLEVSEEFTGDRMTIMALRPFSSPHRDASEKRPAHNSARNAGLQDATGDYVVFLNDCSLVTQDWVSVAVDCAAQNLGWRCKAHIVHDIAMPTNGIVRMKDHHDRLRPIPSATVPGTCWGAPMAAFRQIGGFDIAYDGEDKGHDLDAVLRLARLGVNFVTTERAFCVRLRRTRTKNEISTIKAVFNGVRNLKLIQKLNADPDRILPLEPGQESVEPAPRAAPPRAPRVVLSNLNYPRLAGPAQSAAKRPSRAPAVIRRPARIGDDIPGPDGNRIGAIPAVTNGAGDPDDLSGLDPSELDGEIADELEGLA